MLILIFQSFFLKCNVIPSNTCLSPLVTAIFPNLASIFSMLLVTTLLSTWEIFVSSTYHVIVHCFPLMNLFATQRSYGFKTKPFPFRVLVNNSYHSSADFTQPYSAFSYCIYNTIFPFSIVTYFSYLGFTLHMVSTAFPTNCITKKLGMS